MSLRRAFAYPIAVAAFATLVGCADVQPWERGRLARPDMALRPNPAQRALREHVYMSREAGHGGVTATGGGCGCY